jgi:hypothetical protein
VDTTALLTGGRSDDAASSDARWRNRRALPDPRAPSSRPGVFICRIKLAMTQR